MFCPDVPPDVEEIIPVIAYLTVRITLNFWTDVGIMSLYDLCATF